MTVYELIQELAQFRPDTEVRFHCEMSFDTDIAAEFDRDNENDLQEVTGTADFDDDLSFDSITNKEYGLDEIIIELKY